MLNNRLFFFIPLFSILFILSCSSKKQGGVQKSVEPQPELGCQKAPEFVQIEFSKGQCNGKCPVYVLRIFNNRKAYYIGQLYVRREGLHQSMLSSATFNKVMEKIPKDFQNYKYLYTTSLLDDMPPIITSIKGCDGKIKSVNDLYGPPKELTEFEELLDSIAIKGKDWTPLKTEDPNAREGLRIFRYDDPLKKYRK